MKIFPAYYLLLVFLLPAALTAAISIDAVPKYSKPGCNDTCGNVRIPYPFGIGADCSINPWYVVDCNNLTPYLSAIHSLEILDVNLDDQIVTVNTPKISDCSQPMISMDLGKSPFLFSKSHNKFVAEGCGRAVLVDHGTTLTGCSTNCLNETVSDNNINNNNCIGVTCCQTTIPYYLKSYSVNFTRLESTQGGDGGCGSAFLVAKNSSDEGGFSDAFILVSLLWTLAERDYDPLINCYAIFIMKRIIKVDMGNSIAVDSWRCSSDYKPYEGSPYLKHGCVEREECAKCEGDCLYDRIDDAMAYLKNGISLVIPKKVIPGC